MNEEWRGPPGSPHPPTELFWVVYSYISGMHSASSVFCAFRHVAEFYENERLAKLDLLSARIPQMGGGVNGRFHKLKKNTRDVLVGATRFEIGPPAPKAGALPARRYARHDLHYSF